MSYSVQIFNEDNEPLAAFYATPNQTKQVVELVRSTLIALHAAGKKEGSTPTATTPIAAPLVAPQKKKRRGSRKGMVHTRWTSGEEHRLKRMVSDGDSVRDIARNLKRSVSAVKNRMYRLGLMGEKSATVSEVVKQGETPRPDHIVLERPIRTIKSWDNISQV